MIEISALLKAAIGNGLEYFHIDLKKVDDKAGLLKKIDHALSSSEYFGNELDALGDCLTDMSWKPAAGYVLLFSNFKLFAANNPEDMK